VRVQRQVSPAFALLGSMLGMSAAMRWGAGAWRAFA